MELRTDDNGPGRFVRAIPRTAKVAFIGTLARWLGIAVYIDGVRAGADPQAGPKADSYRGA